MSALLTRLVQSERCGTATDGGHGDHCDKAETLTKASGLSSSSDHLDCCISYSGTDDCSSAERATRVSSNKSREIETNLWRAPTGLASRMVREIRVRKIAA